MADVFRAEPMRGANRPGQVALKVLRPDAGDDAFATETDLMGMLAHPNVVRLLESGRAFGRPYLSLELMDGGDLAHLARRGPLPIGLVLTAAIEVLCGLSYVHEARARNGVPLGLVHSDVNAANVLFTSSGEIKLGDFGVATSVTANIGPPEGTAAGKLSSLSPEQTRGEVLTPASDLWSAAVMIYELVTGTHPFVTPAMSEAEAIDAIRAARFRDERLSPRLADVLRCALRRDPAARYQSAAELGAALLTVARDRGWWWTRAEVRAWLGWAR